MEIATNFKTGVIAKAKILKDKGYKGYKQMSI